MAESGLAIDTEVQVMEGAWSGSVVLLEFPDMAKATAWYSSPEYQKILSLRTDHAISDLILVGGFGPDFTPAGYAKQVTCSDRGGDR
jgi:uncharacterized protein (DUF1330 family)